MRDTGTSGDCSAPGGQEPHEQPDCKGTSATSADVLRACSDILCMLAWTQHPSLSEGGCSCFHWALAEPSM